MLHNKSSFFIFTQESYTKTNMRVLNFQNLKLLKRLLLGPRTDWPRPGLTWQPDSNIPVYQHKVTSQQTTKFQKATYSECSEWNPLRMAFPKRDRRPGARQWDPTPTALKRRTSGKLNRSSQSNNIQYIFRLICYQRAALALRWSLGDFCPPP